MKILTRKVLVPKSADKTIQILKSSAYYFPKAIFEKSSISMYCAKRHNGGYLSLTQVRGTVFEDDDSTIIVLEIHANFNFYFGCTLAFLGLIGLLYCLISYTNRWIPCLGMISLGLLIGGQSLWEASALLDLLEYKLVR